MDKKMFLEAFLESKVCFSNLSIQYKDKAQEIKKQIECFSILMPDDNSEIMEKCKKVMMGICEEIEKASQGFSEIAKHMEEIKQILADKI